MEWFIFWFIVNAIVGAMIGQKKNTVASAVIVSLLLGPVGWLIAALADGDVRKCPFCAENIKPDAIVCLHCQRDVPKGAPNPKPHYNAPPRPIEPELQIKPMSRRARRGWIAAAITAPILLVGALFLSWSCEDRAIEKLIAAGPSMTAAIPRRGEPTATPVWQYIRLTAATSVYTPSGSEKSCQSVRACI